MRPIRTDAGTANYSKADQLDHAVFELQESGTDAERSGKRRRTQQATVGTKVTELNTLLTSAWDPTHAWADPGEQRKAQRLLTQIGNGYRDATRALITQTGQYCAFCDAPLYSDLQAAPILPAEWFPNLAFDFDQQLLVCGPCHTARQRNLTRARGSAATLQDPNTLAWPQLFAQTLADAALLPFRYDLVRMNLVFGQPYGKQLIHIADYPQLLELYQRGYVQVERSWTFNLSRVKVEPPAAESYWISVELSATATNRPVETGIRELIEIFELNGISGQQARGWLDRRVELRTLAYLKALDLKERLRSVQARGDQELLTAMLELWHTTISATGFWGVWLSVFHDLSDIQQRLATCMPGTAARSWVV